MKCLCFVCQKGFDSGNPDAIAGDGRCGKCEEMGKKVAFDIDIKMAEKRRLNPLQPSRVQKILANGGRINARELGINFRP